MDLTNKKVFTAAAASTPYKVYRHSIQTLFHSFDKIVCIFWLKLFLQERKTTVNIRYVKNILLYILIKSGLLWGLVI